MLMLTSCRHTEESKWPSLAVLTAEPIYALKPVSLYQSNTKAPLHSYLQDVRRVAPGLLLRVEVSHDAAEDRQQARLLHVIVQQPGERVCRRCGMRCEYIHAYTNAGW